MVALARQAPCRGARRPGGRARGRRLRRRATRLASARGARLAQAPTPTRGEGLGVAGRLQAGDLSTKLATNLSTI